MLTALLLRVCIPCPIEQPRLLCSMVTGSMVLHYTDVNAKNTHQSHLNPKG